MRRFAVPPTLLVLLIGLAGSLVPAASATADTVKSPVVGQTPNALAPELADNGLVPGLCDLLPPDLGLPPLPLPDLPTLPKLPISLPELPCKK